MSRLPTVYDLKPKFQNLLRPLVRELAEAGVTANQVTILACLLSVATGLALAVFGPLSTGVFWTLPGVLLVRMGLNAVDGMLAREFAMKSNLGALLNELTDVVSDAALYLPFALLPGVLPVLPVACVLIAALTEMTGALGLTIGASRRYDGPMGKSDRAVVFAVLAIALALGAPPGPWLNGALVVVVLVLVLTVWTRARGALREAAKSCG